jgi:hypothetical protein
MKLNLSNIEPSLQDKRRGIFLPGELSSDIAYLIGFHYGDGYLKKIMNNNKIEYRICYTGGAEEFRWYKEFLSPLLFRLFNIKSEVKLHRNTVVIVFSSKMVFGFLNQVCGIPQSPKNNLRFPQILKSLEYKKFFLRGLADADFSITFKKRKQCKGYPVIDFQTSERELRDMAAIILDDLNLKYSKGERLRGRKNKWHLSYHLQISGRDNLEKWLKEVGFCSYKHKSRIRKNNTPQGRISELEQTPNLSNCRPVD